MPLLLGIYSPLFAPYLPVCSLLPGVVESLPGCGGGEHRQADLSALRGILPRHVVSARAAGAAERGGGRCAGAAGAHVQHGAHHEPRASEGAAAHGHAQELRHAARQTEADGGGAADAAHRAAAALYVRVRGSAGAHQHHQGGAAAGAPGHPQLQVHTHTLYSF